MAGVHTIFRTTKKQNGYGANYVAIGGKLKLPYPYKCRNNESQYAAYNGAYPEFIYGFYPGNGAHGFDAGIICKDDGYHMFVADNSKSTKSPFVEPWNEYPGKLNASYGDTITLSCYFTDNKCILKANDQILSVWMRTSYYKAMLEGCYINREMVIAINEDRHGKTHLNPVAYFENARFYNSTLTTTTGKYIAMTDKNTIEYFHKDPGFPKGNYLNIRSSKMSHGFVSDKASATTDSTVHDI